MTVGRDATRPTAVAELPTAPEDRPENAWPGLAAAAAAADVTLTSDQLARFDHYRRLLLDWNRRFNLTAITDPAAVEQRLFLQSLLILPVLDQLLETDHSRLPGTHVRLIDVGSGAGFPGLPLKIARPDLELTLVEATGKKVSFLNHAIAELGLSGATAHHGRAEELGRDRTHRAAYDFVTARAVASLPVLLELSVPFLRVGGYGLFPKGPTLAGELVAAERAAPLLGARLLEADPLPDESTRLVVIAKVAPTSDQFPRRSGIPTREPLGTLGPADNDRRRMVGRPPRAPTGRQPR